MEDLKKLRQGLGKFATGVTIVTCADPDGKPCGITVNSFSSVSLEPPLILWNIAKVSNSLNAYLHARHFAINVLADDQRDLSHHFAQSDNPVFDNVDIASNPHGVPLIRHTLACLECSTEQVHETGDHFIIVGRVRSMNFCDRKPLLFYDGNYAALAE
jgi:flavin reductase (DIM6/NTAB) family NADH-FMN oxidoreductase RutF